MTNRHPFLAVLLLLFIATGAGFASPQAQDTAPLGLQGPIDSLSLKRGTIVVMDFARQLAPGYTVVDPKGKTISAFNLRPGTRVKLELDSQGRVRRIVIQK